MSKKECPSCAMEIDADSKACPICGYEFAYQKSRHLQWIALFLLFILILFFIL